MGKGYFKPTPDTLLKNKVRGSKCSDILRAFLYPAEGKQESLYSSSTDSTGQRGSLCITSLIACGRFPICDRFCSGNTNKRFRQTPSAIINTFAEQATNNGVSTHTKIQICLYASPIYTERGEAVTKKN